MPTCAYCHRGLEPVDSLSKLALTRDHVIPISKGGGKKNWVMCCRQCNLIKADMLPNEWASFMAGNPEWWTYPDLQLGQLQKPPKPRPAHTMLDAVRRAAMETDYRVVVTADHRRKPVHSEPTNRIENAAEAMAKATARSARKAARNQPTP